MQCVSTVRCSMVRSYSIVSSVSVLANRGQKLQVRVKWQYRETHSSIFDQFKEMDRNYASVINNYKVVVPEYFNFARDFIDQWAEIDKNDSDKPLAFWFVYQNGKEVKWTYDELSRNTKKAANALKSLGAGTKWTRCLVIVPKIPEWWLINVACMRLGVVLIPTTPQATFKDIEYRLNSSKSQCIITVSRLMDAVQPICPTVNTKILVNSEGITKNGWENFNDYYTNASDQHRCVSSKSSDILQVFFTSGTTSLPKRVIRTHGDLPLGLFPLAHYVSQLHHRYIYWSITDTGWAKTLWCSLITPWLSGATAFVHEMPTFNPKLTLNILRDYPVNMFCAPPTMFRALINHQIPKFKNLKICACGGEPLNAEIAKKWKSETGMTIFETFAQTEAVAIIAHVPGEPYKIGSMGKRLPGMPIDIVDDNGKVLPIGEKGNIGIKIKPERPLGLFKEYEDDPVKSAKCVAGDYYLTGDRAHEDKDGFFWYDCRADDVITSAGYRIGPFEVESALQEHPDVLESGVVGVSDSERTQIIKAYVILNESGKSKDPDKLKKELQEHVKRVTAPYKYPRQIEFVESLPKTPSGKIKRAELRENANVTSPI